MMIVIPFTKEHVLFRDCFKLVPFELKLQKAVTSTLELLNC